MKYRTTYTRITGDYGIYSEWDYKADHYPVQRPIGTAVGPCVTLRVCKVPDGSSCPDARWLAEVVVHGESVLGFGSVGATRDAAVLAAVEDASEVAA